MKYVTIPERSREEVEAAIRDNDREELHLAALSAALHADDREWAESVCLRLARHDDIDVRCSAVQGLGHIARIHRQLTEEARPVIEAGLEDLNERVRAQSRDTVDDLSMFLSWDFS